MKHSDSAVSADAVRKEYSARQQALETVAKSSGRRSARALVLCAACIVLLLPFSVVQLGVHNSFATALLLIPAFAAWWQVRIFLRARHTAIGAAHRADFYQRRIDRINGERLGGGNHGLDFRREHHLYQDDLHILGEGSLFELLATTRSDAGTERLAAFLLDPVEHGEARARQEAVKELRSAVALREEIDALGKYRFQDCSGTRLRLWLNEPLLNTPKTISVMVAMLSFLTISLAVAGLTQFYAWTALVPLLIVSLAGQSACAIAFVGQVRKRLDVLRTLGSDVSVLRSGIQLVAGTRFQSAKLSMIAERLSEQAAGKAVRTLELYLTAIERRENPVLYGMLVWIAAGTQLVLAVERWRARHQANFEHWLSAWAEFEALSALAGYAYEHPAHVFPDLIDGTPYFEAQRMGHPLLAESICVRNDIALGDITRFYIISGSNMAGKSTLLRAIGLNAVLASAGAPVCARRARVAVMSVCASIGIGDSLRDGASKFFAEVERLRTSIERARKGQPVLFLVDEMLAGTNSRDRCIAAGWMLEELITFGAVGALSTHDLTLCEIAEQEALCGLNVYMQSRTQEDPLDFDYRLRQGIANQTNGLAIVRMMSPGT